MAGPGGGPPRKSHRKSRMGCQTCKRRHIRCDENFPQCRNCTKHTVRCDYLDTPLGSADRYRLSEDVNLLWTPEIEKDIQEWQRTGMIPSLNDAVLSSGAMNRLSPIDLRLIHHISTISAQMQANGGSVLTIWAPKIPIFLTLSNYYGFVMHSILAFSATHLAWITGDSATNNLAFHHRGVAMRGLQEAIPAFAKENSDAVLSASLLLLWQANNWESWASLMKGTLKVIDAMRPWKHESHLLDSMDRLATISPIEVRRTKVVRQEDLTSLQYIQKSLYNIEGRISTSEQGTRTLRDLKAFLNSVPNNLSLSSEEDQFNYLQPLRSWLFWQPVSLLQNGMSPGLLTVLGHLYASAISIEPLFPVVGTACLGRLSLGPFGQIQHMLQMLQSHQSFRNEAFTAMELMEMPMRVAKDAQRRTSWTLQKASLMPQETPYILEVSPYATPTQYEEYGYQEAEYTGYPFGQQY